MKPVNDKIIVSVDLSQKDNCKIGGHTFKMAHLYETNFRNKSPVVATVVDGNDTVRKGDILLCHHNLFYQPSPHFMYDDLFSIPFGRVLFAKILLDGDLLPICGNVLGDRVPLETFLPLPPEQQEKYADRLLVINSGYTRYKKNQLIFTRPNAPYDIVYHWNGEKRIRTKVSDDMICGYAK